MKFITLTIFMVTGLSFSQFKNSSEKAIYSLDNAETNFFKFTGGEISLEYNTWRDSIVYRKKSTNELSAIKYQTVSASLGLTNTKKFNDLDDFQFGKKGIIGKIRYKNSMNEAFVTSNEYMFDLTSYSLGLDIGYDNFDNYNPETNQIENKKPLVISINGDMVFYKFHFQKGFAFGLSLAGSLDLKTYNKNDLINYKELSDDVISTEEIVAFKDFDGKYGMVDKNLTGGNFAFSVPIFIDYEPNVWLPYITPIPFFSTRFLEDTKAIHTTGVVLGVYPKKIFATEVTSVKSKYINNAGEEGDETVRTRKFQAPSFLSIGIDWHLNGDQKGPNIFLTGSISIDRS